MPLSGLINTDSSVSLSRLCDGPLSLKGHQSSGKMQVSERTGELIEQYHATNFICSRAVLMISTSKRIAPTGDASVNCGTVSATELTVRPLSAKLLQQHLPLSQDATYRILSLLYYLWE